MIHIIGNTAVSINADLDAPLSPGDTNNTPASPTLDLTGHGAIQAISAARCGARVSLVSKIGTDIFGKYVLDILRKEGIQTSSLSKNAEQNKLIISLNAPDQTTHIGQFDAPAKLDVDTMPAEYFNARSLIVLSGGIPLDDDITYWLEHVRLNGAKIMLCLRGNNQTLASCADIIVRDETTPLPLLDKEPYLITTKSYGVQGAQAQKGETVACSLQEHKHSHQGNMTSFDIFCGYFSACLQAAIPLKRMLEIASNAAAISTELGNAYSAIPYLGYLEDMEKEEPADKLTAQNY